MKGQDASKSHFLPSIKRGHKWVYRFWLCLFTTTTKWSKLKTKCTVTNKRRIKFITFFSLFLIFLANIWHRPLSAASKCPPSISSQPDLTPTLLSFQAHHKITWWCQTHRSSHRVPWCQMAPWRWWQHWQCCSCSRPAETWRWQTYANEEQTDTKVHTPRLSVIMLFMHTSAPADSAPSLCLGNDRYGKSPPLWRDWRDEWRVWPNFPSPCQMASLQWSCSSHWEEIADIRASHTCYIAAHK